MARSYRKNIIRTLGSTKSRFVAIFAIVALGVGFLAGLLSTPPDMKDSAEAYLDNTNFYDLRVVSTLGLVDADLQALAAVDGVETVQGAYSADLMVQIGDEGDVVVARAHSLPVDANGDPEGDGAINRLLLEEGRWPQAPGECVVEAGAGSLVRGFAVGDTFTATAENEDLDTKLAVQRYTVVGRVRSSAYFSFEREPASIGNGTVGAVFYLRAQDFAYEAYTEAYLTAAGAREMYSLDDAYDARIGVLTDAVEGIAGAECQRRYDELYNEARGELDDAWAEYNDAKQEADTELADAAAELQDGRRKLADGEQELRDGEQEYAEGLRELLENEGLLVDGVQQLNDAMAELQQGQQEYENGLAQLQDGEAQLAEGKRKLEEGQRQYDDGMARWQTGQQQLAALQQLNAGGHAYDEGAALLAQQLTQAGLSVTPEQADALIRRYAALPPERKPMDVGTFAAWLQGELAQIAQGGVPDPAQKEGPPQQQPDLTALMEQLGALDTIGWTETETQALGSLMQNLQAVSSGPTQETLQASLVALESLKDRLQDELYVNLSEMIQGWLQELVQAEQLSQLQNGLAKLAAARVQLDAGLQAIVDSGAAADLNAAKALVSDAGVANLQQQMDTAKQQLDAAGQQLNAGWAEYNQQVEVVRQARAELESAKRTLDDGWATLTDKQNELADAQRQLAEARGTLADAQKTLSDARTTLAEKTQELRDGEIDYADAKAEVEQKLADAKAEIEDGEATLADLELPEWYVWDRSNNVSYSSFESNAAKLQALTTIFPIFFFLVAALVVSTTMTRMVEEERLQIGTLKALGYTTGAIMKKYLVYALLAGLSGTVLGLGVGFIVFPKVIWTAYQMMYYLPQFYMPFRWNFALLAGGALTGGTVLVTLVTCRATLRENPAALMRPRAPKAGKRILLERIPFLWRRLPFSYKVTARNLLRYKRRFWMTVLGVSGCTALLVAGFGISDSLDSIITKQYEDVYKYQLMTVLTKQQATEQGDVYEYLFGQPELFSASLATAMEHASQPGANGNVDAYLLVPRDVAQFADFADLHERTTRNPTPLGEQGVVLTEKLATQMGVAAGETVTLKNTDDKEGTFLVTGVCEHYVSNYVYMSEATYTEGFGAAPTYNAVLSLMPDDSQPVRDAVSADLLDAGEVASLSFTQDNIAMVLNMLTSIDAVVVLIIVCAACLAFVVLYNLTNINIAERVKEIATIKVLGFFEREVNAYVNRESVALTLIGTALGLALGIVLHRFIIVTVEVDAVMFGRSIRPISFVYAAALTLLFSTLVDLFMRRSLRRISMVESMKAPE